MYTHPLRTNPPLRGGFVLRVPPRCPSKAKTKTKTKYRKPPTKCDTPDTTLDLLAKLPQNVTHSKIKDYNA